MGTESNFIEQAGGMATLAPADLVPGLCIAGRYELLRQIGSGAMGQVWAARHVSLGEEVAIKLILRDVSHTDGSSADSRFLLEARVASQLSRKTRHIVTVTDHGDHGPYAYLVMELLSGESLEARLARTGPMPLAKVTPLIYQIARALTVAHNDGVIHRDLKTSNVFVTVDEDGRALLKILDFGIAKSAPSMRRIRLARPSGRPSQKHATLHGFLLGTPAYMSPEQARAEVIDSRADVWALAVMAYHLLTGEFPFDGDTPEELFTRLIRVQPCPISTWRPDLPPVVSDLFARAFSERIEHRFPNAVALAAAFEHIDAMERRQAGMPPPAMLSISVPPPSTRVVDETPSVMRKSMQSLITAAKIPQKRVTWPRVLAGSAVLLFLLATARVLTLSDAPESSRPHGLAAVVTAGVPSSEPRVFEVREDDSDDRHAVPAPEPYLATTPPPAQRPPVVRPAQASFPAAAAMPMRRADPPAPIAVQSQPQPSRNRDRSEIF